MEILLESIDFPTQFIRCNYDRKMTAEFACNPSCEYCTRYQSEELAYVNEPLEGNPNDDYYIMHVSRRVMRHAETIKNTYEKSLFVIKYYNLLLSNTFFLKESKEFARSLLLTYKYDHFVSRNFNRVLETLRVNGYAWMGHLETIVRELFSSWGHKVFSCDRDCEHCRRYIETKDGILENYLFGCVHEHATKPRFENGGDEYVAHIYERIIDLSTRQKTDVDKYMLYIVAGDFLLRNASFTRTHPNERNSMISFLEEVDDNIYIILNRIGSSLDIEAWIKHFEDLVQLPVVASHTDHEDLIFKQIPEIGTMYVKCTLKEDHIMDYNVMANRGPIERIKCIYCQSPLHGEIYEQV
jgi:hypothetical protein